MQQTSRTVVVAALTLLLQPAYAFLSTTTGGVEHPKCFVNRKTTKSQHFDISRRSRIEKHQAALLRAATNNNNSKEESIDRAPCFDGACDSDPDAAFVFEGDDEVGASASATTTLSTTQLGEATKRLGGPAIGPTVWSEFGRLASEKGSDNIANLGQGFPDWLPPQFALDALVEAATDLPQNSPHQYTRTAGHPNLVKQLAKRYSVHLKRHVDPMNEVAVTVGASQALYLSLQTLLNPGDEVILFEPFFDLYVNQVKLAGGTPVYVPLTFKEDSKGSGKGEWILESAKLENALTSKTKAIILNSPHNPTGKVFDRKEMMSIANALETKASQDCVVISDEVYKYIIHSPPKEDEYDNNQDNNNSQQAITSSSVVNGEDNSNQGVGAVSCPGHVHFASLPGMWERTITISSAGKTFSATGWQVGWCIAPPKLMAPIHQLLPYVQFCASTVMQEALARALPRADLPYEGHKNYYEYLKHKYTRKRDLLAQALEVAGFAVPNYQQVAGGGFFIFARVGDKIKQALPQDKINVPNKAAPGGMAHQDWALCQWLVEELGVLCIPSSPFFSKERAIAGDSDEFVRIAFCKTDETIEAAAAAFLLMHDTKQSPSQENPLKDEKEGETRSASLSTRSKEVLKVS